MNFLALLTGFQSIAGKHYEAAEINDYFKIPENRRRLFDLLLRNASVEYGGNKYIIDIGINQHETGTADNREDYFTGTIDDVGDLSTFYGYDEFNLEGMTVSPGKIFKEQLNSLDDLKDFDFFSLYEDGCTYVKLLNIPEESKASPFPIDILKNDERHDFEIGVNAAANFVVYQDGKIRFVVINGFIVDLESRKGDVLNGIVR